jgi:class 3 adenylate cyclase
MSAPTWELVKDRFETRPLGDVEIRGLSSPIPLYTVTACAAAART